MSKGSARGRLCWVVGSAPQQGAGLVSTGLTGSGVARHHLTHDGRLVQTFEPGLTDLQRQVLDLLDIPHSAYTDPAWPGGPKRSPEVRKARCRAAAIGIERITQGREVVHKGMTSRLSVSASGGQVDGAAANRRSAPRETSRPSDRRHRRWCPDDTDEVADMFVLRRAPSSA